MEMFLGKHASRGARAELMNWKGVTRSRNSQENLWESCPESKLGSHLVIKITWQWTNSLNSLTHFHTFTLSPVIHCWAPQVLVSPVLKEEREEIGHWISYQGWDGLPKTIEMIVFKEEEKFSSYEYGHVPPSQLEAACQKLLRWSFRLMNMVVLHLLRVLGLKVVDDACCVPQPNPLNVVSHKWHLEEGDNDD